MPTPLSAPDLANAVTSFCTIGAGLTGLILCVFVGPQPKRWWYVYLTLFITGIPTLGWHGWGGEFWRLSDIGTNLLLAFVLQIAVLGDFYMLTTRRLVTLLSGLFNAFAITRMAGESYAGNPHYTVDFGSFGGFYIGEVALIIDAILVVGLMYARADQIPANAKPLLRLIVLCFLIGLGLAAADGDVVHGRVWSYHALWHVIGAFGFILFWAFNEVRFRGRPIL